MTGAEFTGEVHPVADLFPMLGEDEFAELVESIASVGLDDPIVLDGEGRLLDGRNRLAACEAAGVEPSFEMVEVDDPAAYVLRHGLIRRSLSKGQQAMIAARAWAVSAQTQRAAAGAAGVSKTRVTQAAAVLDHAPDLVDAVVAGDTSLDEAYAEARDRKAAAESAEAQLAKLRDTHPDLADQVDDESLTLGEAIAAGRQRDADRAEAIRRDVERIETFLHGFETARTLTDNAWRDEVLDGLAEPDRDRFLTIEKETAWPSTPI